MELRLHTCRPGEEGLLLAELDRVLPASRHRRRAEGLCESHLADQDAEATPSLGFATQCVPVAAPVAAATVRCWADALAALFIQALAHHDGPWRLHVFATPARGGAVSAGRCRLVEAGLLERLKAKQRRLVRSRLVDASGLWVEGEALVQVLLETREAGFSSICSPDLRHRLRRCMSRFAAGAVAVRRDPRPPSRAYLKLLEAQERLGRHIAAGDTCADLGASPGGWTHVALAAGAKVVAVDRSPLRGDLMANPRLIYVRGDAFRYEPTSCVDWLLCDVIAFPERTLELVARWVGRRLCRRFVVTMKFRGAADYPRIEELKHTLERTGAEFTVRRLDANKNEVTAFGEVSTST